MSGASPSPEFASPGDVAEGTEVVPPPAEVAAGSESAVSTPAGAVPGTSSQAGPAGLASAIVTISDALPEDALSASIHKLKAKQNELRAQKQKLAKDLRNAERRKKRLRSRARQLTDEDLVQVLMLRKQQRGDRLGTDTSADASTGSSSSCGMTTSSGTSSSSGAASSSGS